MEHIQVIFNTKASGLSFQIPYGGERSGWVGFWASGVNLQKPSVFGSLRKKGRKKHTLNVNILSSNTTLRCFFGQLDKLGTVFCLELRG